MEASLLDQRLESGEDPSESWDWGEVRRICLNIAFRYAKNTVEAEDIAQDSVMRAWSKKSTLRDPEARTAWLATIVRNEALRELTRKRPSPIDTLDAWQGSEDERVIALVDWADLHAAIERLNDRDRQLVRLRYDEDMTQEAIARRLGVPLGTIKVRLHRVRATLRRSLGVY